jgi:hypothetical protein
VREPALRQCSKLPNRARSAAPRRYAECSMTQLFGLGFGSGCCVASRQGERNESAQSRAPQSHANQRSEGPEERRRQRRTLLPPKQARMDHPSALSPEFAAMRSDGGLGSASAGLE